MGIIFSFFKSENQTLSPPYVFKLNSTNNIKLNKKLNNKLNNKQFVADFPQEDNLKLFLTVVLNGKLISGNLEKYKTKNINDYLTEQIKTIYAHESLKFPRLINEFNLIEFPNIPLNKLCYYYDNIKNNLNLKVSNEYGKFLIYYSYLRTNDLYECIYLMKYLFPYFNYCFYLNETNKIMEKFKKVSGVPLVIRVFDIFKKYITPYAEKNPEFKEWILNILQENSGSPNEKDINVNFINIMREVYKNIDYKTYLKLIPDIYQYDILVKGNLKMTTIISEYQNKSGNKIKSYDDGSFLGLFAIITKKKLDLFEDFKTYINSIDITIIQPNENYKPKKNNIPRKDIKVKNSIFSTKVNTVNKIKEAQNHKLPNNNRKNSKKNEVLPPLNSMNKDLKNILYLKKYVFNPTFKKDGKSVFNAIKKLYTDDVLGMTDKEINNQTKKNSNRIVGYFTPIYKNKYSETQIEKITKNYFSIMEDVKNRGIKTYPQDWFQNVFLGIILDNSFNEIYFRAYQMVPYDFFLIEGSISMNLKIMYFFIQKYNNDNFLHFLNRQWSLMFYGEYIEIGLSIDNQYLNKLKIGYSYADYTKEKCKFYYEKYGLSYMEYSINLLDIICGIAFVNEDKFYKNISNNNKLNIEEFSKTGEISNNEIIQKFKYYYIKSLNEDELDQKCKDALKIMPEFYNYLIKNGVVSESAKEKVKKQKKYITSIITQPIKFD